MYVKSFTSSQIKKGAEHRKGDGAKDPRKSSQGPSVTRIPSLTNRPILRRILINRGVGITKFQTGTTQRAMKSPDPLRTKNRGGFRMDNSWIISKGTRRISVSRRSKPNIGSFIVYSIHFASWIYYLRG